MFVLFPEAKDAGIPQDISGVTREGLDSNL